MNKLLHTSSLFALAASEVQTSVITAAFLRRLNSFTLTFTCCIDERFFLSFRSIIAQFKRIKELNWSFNVCLLRPKFLQLYSCCPSLCIIPQRYRYSIYHCVLPSRSINTTFPIVISICPPCFPYYAFL